MHEMISKRSRPGLRAWAVLVAAALFAASSVAHAEGSQGRKSEAAAQGSPASVVVDLNTATESDLQALPGIGPAKARAIVALRDRLGKFERIEQILRVRGIGRATFRKLRPMLTVGKRGGARSTAHRRAHGR